ncbi:hypothetical protein [Sorangium sp. So ce131]|uniref:hypothetical protein n=1 Tax=Sorangium sp. So ce131 TaxID=3133282 RepID=UPI003F61DA49
MRDALAQAKRALSRQGALLVIDVDGTLADDVGRRHLRPVPEPHCLGGVSAEQIDRYMAPELVALDACVRGAQRFLVSLLRYLPLRGRNLAVVTARWDTLRSITELWLAANYGFLRPCPLLMRRWGDSRPSVDVKLELVLERGTHGVWLDDDPRMLAAAEQIGFVPLKAPEAYTPSEEVQCSTER